jgi:putative phage-type endonuclease
MSPGIKKMPARMITLGSREEWLEKRQSYIGGSEASSIVGMNPYMSNVELWEIKTGRRQREDISNKPYVLYGIRAEEHLRALFELDFPQYAVFYKENNMWLNPDYPFAHASLDGYLVERETGRFGILEIKTTNILQSMQREKWDHRIPDNYYIQILHYLMVTGADFAVLKAQLKYDYDGDIYLTTKHYHIEREEVIADIDFLAEKERDFAGYIERDECPPLVLPEI